MLSSTSPPTSKSSPKPELHLSYLSLTEHDREEMLATIGVDTVDELFRDIPEGVRFGRELDLEPALSEQELSRELSRSYQEKTSYRRFRTSRESLGQ